MAFLVRTKLRQQIQDGHVFLGGPVSEEALWPVEVQRLIDRYGGVGVAIAALTPLPYSLASWAAGTSTLGYARFVAISLPFRAIRVSAVLWLLSIGLWAIQS